VDEPTQNSTSSEEEEQLPVTPEPKGAAPEPEKGAEKEEGKETPKAPRTYSEEDWNKRQSSWDKGLEELKKQHKEEIKQIRGQLQQQLRQDFLRKVEEEGGDVTKAGDLFDREQAILAKEQEVGEGLALLEKVKKDQDASDFIEKFDLPKEAKDQLLKAGSPAEMRSIALELALEKEKAGKTPPVKTASAVGTGKGVDTSKMSPRERAEAYFSEVYGKGK